MIERWLGKQQMHELYHGMKTVFIQDEKENYEEREQFVEKKMGVQTKKEAHFFRNVGGKSPRSNA